jgi:deoxyxylulose-5-phosphate synthase
MDRLLFDVGHQSWRKQNVDWPCRDFFRCCGKRVRQRLPKLGLKAPMTLFAVGHAGTAISIGGGLGARGDQLLNRQNHTGDRGDASIVNGLRLKVWNGRRHATAANA